MADDHQEHHVANQSVLYQPAAKAAEGAYVKDLDEYRALYNTAMQNPDQFWGDLARNSLVWEKPFHTVSQGGFEHGDVAWFVGGKLNVAYNCVDRHQQAHPDRVAIIWEGDEPDQIRKITYSELLREVCKFANLLRSHGVRKGDTVAIYMPMVPEAAYAMLACARIGAIHSVVFAGFSADALRDRILDAGAKILITADEGLRGGKVIPLKKTSDEALLSCPNVKTVLVYKRTGGQVPWNASRDVVLNDALAAQRPYCPPEVMDSEDPLFILYTSGSTGKPKGMVHTTAGYLLYVGYTHNLIFDYHPNQVYACVADIGWITGHSYILYGPLCNGATTLMFESVPFYPSPERYWDLITRHKVNILYTAPTAIRALMKYGEAPVQKYGLDTLRVLGSVGEPINPQAWIWYHDIVGKGKCSIVDTYWQTETGGIVVTPLPGATPTKPGSATFPFIGIDVVVLDKKTGQVIEENDKQGVVCIRKPWPSIARTIWGDHKRYLTTYFQTYNGYYFTGDGCHRDKDGYLWITGRVDDAINVSGHLIGTAEIESALVSHSACAEAAVIAVPHDIKGSDIVAFVSLKAHYHSSEKLNDELKMEVRKRIGAFAVPSMVISSDILPKTRSGKIMRRVLRKIATGETDSLGDTSTLTDPEIIASLIAKVQAHHKKH